MKEGRPRRHVNLSLEVYDEQQKVVRKTPLLYFEGSAGDYKANLEPLPEGRYSILPVLPDSDRNLEQARVSVLVKNLPTHERLALQYNPAKLAQLCHEVQPLDQLLNMIKSIEPQNKKHLQRIDIEIWDTFPFMLLVGLLLGLEMAHP